MELNKGKEQGTENGGSNEGKEQDRKKIEEKRTKKGKQQLRRNAPPNVAAPATEPHLGFGGGSHQG